MPDDTDQILAKRHRLKHLDLYDVSGDELDNLEQLGSTVGTDLQFCTFWLPIGISSTLTLIAVPITNPHVFLVYVVAAFVGYGFGGFHGVRWYFSRAQFKRCIDKIRQRQIGPIGQQGKELKPSELDTLPSGTPTDESSK